jgi:hypothetical protein
MAALDTLGNRVTLEAAIDTFDNFKVMIWNVKLSGAATDTFVVPGCTTTNGVGIMLKGPGEDPEIPPNLAGADSRTAAQANLAVSVTAVTDLAAGNQGRSTVTVANTASPRRENRVIICTLHRKGMSNNPVIDPDPT